MLRRVNHRSVRWPDSPDSSNRFNPGVPRWSIPVRTASAERQRYGVRSRLRRDDWAATRGRFLLSVGRHRVVRLFLHVGDRTAPDRCGRALSTRRTGQRVCPTAALEGRLRQQCASSPVSVVGGDTRMDARMVPVAQLFTTSAAWMTSPGTRTVSGTVYLEANGI